MQNNKRIHYIDIARAFAMIIIVISHALSCAPHAYPIYKVLFSFSVPLFFILSGMTFKIKQDETFWKFLKTKIVRIIFPYLFWGLAFLIPYFLFGQQIGADLSQSSSFNLWQQIANVFYGNGIGDSLKQNTPLWFLPALFSTEIIYYFIIKFVEPENTKSQILLAAIILGLGFGASILLQNFYLPFGLNTALEAGIFFYLGHMIKEVDISNFVKSGLLKIVISIGLIIIGLLSVKYNTESNIVWSDYLYNNYFLCVLSGISLSLPIISFSRCINKNRLLEYIGKNTMSILIFHKVFVIIFQTKTGLISNLLHDSNILLETLLAVIISLVSVFVTIFIGLIIRKIFPQLIGEKSKRLN